uniref:Retinoic acid receptor alpha n=1 Tax=Knipowitschia caucasica TaxID=637954 RepID=A0AAV2LFZ5_KNICA
MAGKGNPVPGPHLNGFPMPTYSYFFPHMLGSLSPPALPGLSISGYSTPSPAIPDTATVHKLPKRLMAAAPLFDTVTSPLCGPSRPPYIDFLSPEVCVDCQSSRET